MIKIKNSFDLKSTITCGQIFRFIVEEDNSFTIIIKDRVINLKEESDYIIIESSNENNLNYKYLEQHKIETKKIELKTGLNKLKNRNAMFT